MPHNGPDVRSCLWLIALAALLASCRTTPQAARMEATAPAPGPTSIAYRSGAGGAVGWTTPEGADLPVLRRGNRALRAALEDPTESALSRQHGVRGDIGSPVERRLGGGVATGGPWELYLTTTSLYLFGGDLSNSENGVDTWVNRFRLSLEKPLDYFGRLGVNATYVFRRYRFDGSNSLVEGTDDPFDSVHAVSAGVNIFQPVSESFAVIASVDAAMSAEVGADLLDAFSWSVTVGGGYRVSDTLNVGAGVFVAGRFEEDLLVFGGPQFDWRPSDAWQLELLGPQLKLTYHPNPTWELGVAGGFSSIRFRLRDDAPGNSQIFTDSRLPVYARLRYRGGTKSDIELRAGVDVYRDLVVEDARGRNGRGVTADPAPFIGFRWILEL